MRKRKSKTKKATTTQWAEDGEDCLRPRIVLPVLLLLFNIPENEMKRRSGGEVPSRIFIKGFFFFPHNTWQIAQHFIELSIYESWNCLQWVVNAITIIFRFKSDKIYLRWQVQARCSHSSHLRGHHEEFLPNSLKLLFTQKKTAEVKC